MCSKLSLVLCALICFTVSLEAASLRGAAENTFVVAQKLDYEGVEANVRTARQNYAEDDSGEDSDEDDDEDDAESQHQDVIRRQQAYEESVDNSQEGSNEDSEDIFEDDDDDDDDFFGRRIRRDVPEAVSSNEIQENSKPAENSENTDKQPAVETSSASTPTPSNSGSSNTSVLILIRDAIKKVTELPNTQQVATSAQQYFQLFEHFLQQTIEQVIGDDDDEDEVEIESSTIVTEEEKEPVTEITEISDSSVKPDVSETTSDKETSVEQEVLQPEKKPEDTNEIKA